LIDVQRTDFATVVTQDKERALRFYGEVLGLRRNENAHEDWPEFETGNITLCHYEPLRSEFTPSISPIATSAVPLRRRVREDCAPYADGTMA
jgi:catechol 2,3-dioxygenase-like lactoylglutathione lyase family enzyme